MCAVNVELNLAGFEKRAPAHVHVDVCARKPSEELDLT